MGGGEQGARGRDQGAGTPPFTPPPPPYQLGWAGWQVYITEQSEGSIIKYYYLTSYYHCANPYYSVVNLTVVHGSSVMAAGVSLRDFSA